MTLVHDSCSITDHYLFTTGDHGFHLGENGEWEKTTNFDLANHLPMMLRVPGATEGGVRVGEIIESVDLAPTVVRAAGLPEMPPCPDVDSALVDFCAEGDDLTPLIDKTGTAAHVLQNLSLKAPLEKCAIVQ